MEGDGLRILHARYHGSQGPWIRVALNVSNGPDTQTGVVNIDERGKRTYLQYFSTTFQQQWDWDAFWSDANVNILEPLLARGRGRPRSRSRGRSLVRG